ncbi:glycosyltransferase [Tenacibaculum sp. UWU-22]|uniref:glycosyltransferase n=1 Tax=Tenacibaculum sp. UWU-22 TaxID=3234187 RepID=UPI0034DACD3B
MEEKLNILFLNSWYPNIVQPFNGNFIQQHARALSLCCNVACLNVEYKEQKSAFEISSVQNKGVFEVIVYIKKPMGVLAWVKKIRRRHVAYKKGLEVIKKQFSQIHLTHLNVIYPAGFFALYLKKNFNIPYIITEHSTVYLNSNHNSFSGVKNIFIKNVVKKASKICTVSNDLKEAMMAKGYKGSYAVVPNVVNTQYFKFLDKEVIKPLKILHVSSLKEEHKNVKAILRVVKKLHKKRTDFTITIISDGNLESIKKYAENIELSKAVLKTEGAKTIENIALEMQKHDLFLLFSNYENSPCVISESLVSGIPVISSNVGGIKEMISDTNGVLVEAANETELLNKLDDMLNRITTYDRKKIAKEAKEKYSYQVVSNQFLSIYKEVLTQ